MLLSTVRFALSGWQKKNPTSALTQFFWLGRYHRHGAHSRHDGPGARPGCGESLFLRKTEHVRTALTAGDPLVQRMDPHAIAQTFLDLAHQPKSCWTQGAFWDEARSEVSARIAEESLLPRAQSWTCARTPRSGSLRRSAWRPCIWSLSPSIMAWSSSANATCAAIGSKVGGAGLLRVVRSRTAALLGSSRTSGGQRFTSAEVSGKVAPVCCGRAILPALVLPKYRGAGGQKRSRLPDLRVSRPWARSVCIRTLEAIESDYGGDCPSCGSSLH